MEFTREYEKKQLTCYECGLLYGGRSWCDVIIPDYLWKMISPTGDEGGILCFNCIAGRLNDRGYYGVPVTITSGPFKGYEQKLPVLEKGNVYDDE